MANPLGLVIVAMGEAEALEQAAEGLRIGAGELDELEAVEAERVVVGHL